LVTYPAVHEPGSIETLLKIIESGNIPKIADNDYIESAGFKRQLDENLLGLLLFLGFIDDNGVPSELWTAFANPAKAPKLLGSSVMAGYHKLYSEGDVSGMDGQQLMAFFKRETKASDAIAAYMVLTFQVLCDLAVFEDIPPEPATPAPKKPPSRPEPFPATVPSAAAVNQQCSTVSTKTDTNAPVKLTLEIDVRSDPELRRLLLKLLRRQLEE
jgi:hypothetical protein